MDVPENQSILEQDRQCASRIQFLLRISPRLPVPIYRQLFDQLKAAIENLQLMPGELLPSSRELASVLGVSRKTISRCYEELLSQGFITSESGVGTFVRQLAKTDSPPTDAKLIAGSRLTEYAERLLSYPSGPTNQGEFPELHFGAPPPEELPIKTWRQVLLKQLRECDLTQVYYDTDPFGYLPLRSALASYLFRSRALVCDPEQLIVFSHALSPLKLFAQIVIEQNNSVVVENPGFPFARRLFSSLGAQIIPVGLDGGGLRVEELQSIPEKPSLIYVTPSHQDPTGAMLILERRTQLLNWAKDHDCLILEDDYDCEFRHAGSTLPALMALDRNETVAYIGDMWKTLFPLINIGYLVLPKGLVDIFRHAQSLSWTKISTSLPFYDQLAITEFINDGHFERHVRKTKTTYANRYRNLVLGLTRFFGDVVTWANESGGMQLLVKFNTEINDAIVIETAKLAGLSVIPTTSYYCEQPADREFLIAFVMLEEDDMTTRLERWARLLRG
ncbi:MAG: PLP-dependent aminotransferase family protein [Candidatus Obscuribacterales bacterium]|nr:PLP-dependent aminotransferase family protein [Candidatus Obscuribacterales bacterium]